jgi:hypothetical protein
VGMLAVLKGVGETEAWIEREAETPNMGAL